MTAVMFECLARGISLLEGGPQFRGIFGELPDAV